MELCNEYITYLNGKKKELEYISTLKNDFKDWLKFEFCIMCAKKTEWNWNANKHFGVEYCAHLESDQNRLTKEIDIWTYGGTEDGNDSRHYIELNIAFNTIDKRKQIDSWINDFEALNKLEIRENANGIASIIFGVDFTNDEWQDIIGNTIQEYHSDCQQVIKTFPLPYAILFPIDE